MWKCKECGSTKFKVGVSAYVNANFNIIGMKKIDETSFEIIAEENVECCECENDGQYIQHIADWVEDEDERD